MDINKTFYSSKNKSYRNNFRFNEKKKIIYFFLIYNTNLSYKKKISIKFKFHKNCLQKNSSITKINNVCLFTNRKKGVYSKLKISRIYFRKLMKIGALPGWRKI